MLWFLILSQFNNQGVGTTVHPILKTGFGPRVAGMGNAFVGLADDINALWWNPAGVNQMETWEAMAVHREWLQGIRDEFLSIVWPNSPTTTIGFGVNLSTAGGIEHWDENNFPVLPDSIISVKEGLLLLTYTRRFIGSSNIGIGIKGIYEDLYDAQAFGGALDIGIHTKLSSIGIGLSIYNLSPGLFYPDGLHSLPLAGRIGIAYKPSRMFSFVSDIEASIDNIPSLHTGAEFYLPPIASARIGYATGPKTLAELNPLSGLTAGLGIWAKENLRFDYTVEPFGVLGTTHRLGISYIFGERPKTGALVVRVVDKETKKPLPANLELKGVVRKKLTLSSTGKWQRAGIRPGKVEIKAEMHDYYPSTARTEVKAGKTTEKIIELSKIPPGRIKGRVYDVKTNKPLEATIYYEGPEKGEVTTKNGRYETPSLYRGEYVLKVKPKHPKYFPQEAKVVVEPDKTTVKDFSLLREKEVIVFHTIHFETGKARLLPDSYPILDHIGKILLDNPSIKVELSGHTDPRPIHTKEFKNNMELSQARAEAVRNYLIEKFKISPERLIAKGYGDTKPIAPNDTEEGMAMNRRVEFKVLTGLEYYHEIKTEKAKPEELKP